MKVKKYEAKTGMAISVTFENGEGKLVEFDSTSKGSVLWTRDEQLQKAIERHRFFGKTIKLAYEEGEDEEEAAETVAEEDNDTIVADMNGNVEEDAETDDEEEADAVETPATDEAETEEEAGDADEDEAETEEKKVTVSGAEDAVEYLMDNYGVKRSQVKSIKKIREVASQYGIIFEGLD